MPAGVAQRRQSGCLRHSNSRASLPPQHPVLPTPGRARPLGHDVSGSLRKRDARLWPPSRKTRAPIQNLEAIIRPDPVAATTNTLANNK